MFGAFHIWSTNSPAPINSSSSSHSRHGWLPFLTADDEYVTTLVTSSVHAPCQAHLSPVRHKPTPISHAPLTAPPSSVAGDSISQPDGANDPQQPPTFARPPSAHRQCSTRIFRERLPRLVSPNIYGSLEAASPNSKPHLVLLLQLRRRLQRFPSAYAPPTARPALPKMAGRIDLHAP